MRQLIIARKDLNMGPGKMAAQVSHASMAFLTDKIQKESIKTKKGYETHMLIDAGTYEKWISGIFTKTICAAKNKNQLMKAVTMAEELGMKQGEDFFLIKDACLTDLQPEEYDEDGNGWTLTCIGFRPLDDDTAHKISKKYQLYH